MRARRHLRDPQEAAQEYRQQWRRTRQALAEYLAYTLNEGYTESTGYPIHRTADFKAAARALGIDPNQSIEELDRELGRIFRGPRLARARGRDPRRTSRRYR